MRAILVAIVALVAAFLVVQYRAAATADTCSDACDRAYATCAKSCKQSDTNCFTRCINEKNSCLVKC